LNRSAQCPVPSAQERRPHSAINIHRIEIIT
jgi:hypothetical protein